MEVDHITPKNKFGEDSIHNYQALCYTCNSQKRDLDDTDFREIKHIYEMRDTSCVFCNIPNGRILFENNRTMAFHDNYPVTKGHLLIVPRINNGKDAHFKINHFGALPVVRRQKPSMILSFFTIFTLELNPQ